MILQIIAPKILFESILYYINGNPPIFFTAVSRQCGCIFGYKLRCIQNYKAYKIMNLGNKVSIQNAFYDA